MTSSHKRPSHENNCGTRLHHKHKRYSSQPRRLNRNLQRYTLRKHNRNTNKTSHFGEKSINNPNLHMEHYSTGFAKGSYTIWAYAWPVQGETETTDNTFTDGLVNISIPGDINADGIVDVYDLILVGSAFGSCTGSPNYNPNADINNDNTIDIYDLILVASHFGEVDS